MRLIHTSDWHIGKLIYEQSLLEDQHHVLLQLLDAIQTSQPDAVIIAGDIFDRPIPPTDAVKLLEWALEQITLRLNTPVVMISGNHDSGERLGFGSRLLDPRRIRIIGSYEEMEVPFRVADSYGEVAIYGIPYFDPVEVRVRSGDPSIHSHPQALGWCTQRIQSLHGDSRAAPIVVAHAFVRNSKSSESERPLAIGGSEQVDASLFDSFCYTALGHLHRPQNPTPRARYCGSLLAYHFDEHDNPKSFTLVDLAKDRVPQLTTLPITPRRRMRVISGTFDEILAQGRSAPSVDFILARRTWDGPRVDMMGQLRKVYPNLLAIENVMPAQTQGTSTDGMIRNEDIRKGRNTFDTFEHFFKTQSGTALNPEQASMIKKLIGESAS